MEISILEIVLSILIVIFFFMLIRAKQQLSNHKKKQPLQDIALLNEKNKVSNLEKRNYELVKDYTNISAALKSLQKDYSVSHSKLQELMQVLNLKDELFEGLKIKTNETVSKITSLYSDFLLVQYEISEKFLMSKKNPAIVEAVRIKDLKSQTKAYKEQYRQMLYKYEYLLQLFPELINYVDDFKAIQELEGIKSVNDLQEDFDRVTYYISKEEYHKLSTNERNQLALDRYIEGQKSSWQIGRDYELFCGREYEKDKWVVEYTGMEQRLEDLGRDLIAQKGDEVHIVQCKFWSLTKTIHEKHIAQLFGTAKIYELSNDSNLNVKPVFMTNTNLSPTAINFARNLNVSVVIKQLQEFPRIKCNISKNEYGYESRIYHLPFDQQYDRTQIKHKEEFYAFTVEEATNMGFRRAFKYYGA